MRLLIIANLCAHRCSSGMSIDYGDSQLVHKSKSTKQELASKLPIGKRFISAQVVNVASATGDQLATRIPTNGAFRLLVFPGNVAEPKQMSRLKALAAYLDRPDTFLSKYTPRSSKGRDEIIDVITIRGYPFFCLLRFQWLIHSLCFE